jgi:hypothetical protein
MIRDRLSIQAKQVATYSTNLSGVLNNYALVKEVFKRTLRGKKVKSMSCSTKTFDITCLERWGGGCLGCIRGFTHLV